MMFDKGLDPAAAFFGHVDKMPSATSLCPGVCRTTQDTPVPVASALAAGGHSDEPRRHFPLAGRVLGCL